MYLHPCNNVHSILGLLSTQLPTKSSRYWLFKIEYLISPNSDSKMSSQSVIIFSTIIENSISSKSELKLSTQYLKFFTIYWVWTLSWTLISLLVRKQNPSNSLQATQHHLHHLLHHHLHHFTAFITTPPPS